MLQYLLYFESYIDLSHITSSFGKMRFKLLYEMTKLAKNVHIEQTLWYAPSAVEKTFVHYIFSDIFHTVISFMCTEKKM